MPKKLKKKIILKKRSLVDKKQKISQPVEAPVIQNTRKRGRPRK